MFTNQIDPGAVGLRVHAFQTGRLIGNRTFMRGEGWSSLLRRRADYEFPVYSYVVEHPEGLIAIDTGLAAGVRAPAWQGRFVPAPVVEAVEEIGPRMRACGLRPEDVRRVILTHLDWDHAGGLAHFPEAEVLVHRPEYEFASTAMGRMRYQPRIWPASFRPRLYDLEARPYGPFDRSRPLTDAGDVVAVPLPGHSIGQVGVVVSTGGARLLFAGDHMLRQDWFCEDYEAGRLIQLGVFFRAESVETSRRIHRFLDDDATVLLPAHDDEAPARLERQARAMRPQAARAGGR